MVFAKFDLSIYYPPSYKRTAWYYNRGNADVIRRAIDLFYWDKALRINYEERQVAIFRDTLMNIMQNFVPNATFICDDTDPLWMSKEIKQFIEQEKKKNFTSESFEVILYKSVTTN